MTKPITSTAALRLFEESRFALDNPIALWGPEFSEMIVLRSSTGPLDLTVPSERPIAFEDLPTHRSCLTYGSFHAGPIARPTKRHREVILTARWHLMSGSQDSPASRCLAFACRHTRHKGTVASMLDLYQFQVCLQSMGESGRKLQKNEAFEQLMEYS